MLRLCLPHCFYHLCHPTSTPCTPTRKLSHLYTHLYSYILIYTLIYTHIHQLHSDIKHPSFGLAPKTSKDLQRLNTPHLFTSTPHLFTSTPHLFTNISSCFITSSSSYSSCSTQTPAHSARCQPDMSRWCAGCTEQTSTIPSN